MNVFVLMCKHFSQKCEYFSQKNGYASFPDATSVRKGTVSFMVKQCAKRVPTTTSLSSVKLYQHYIHFYSPSGFSVPLNFFFLSFFLLVLILVRLWKWMWIWLFSSVHMSHVAYNYDLQGSCHSYCWFYYCTCCCLPWYNRTGWLGVKSQVSTAAVGF